jgi:tRNA (guanine-N7-)-methyltransferase
VGKNKLARWRELSGFRNVFQPDIEDVTGNDHPLRGRWKKEVFRNENPIILELGCGRGEYTTGLASRFPSNNYIGVDIKGARLWRGAKTANEKNMPNAAFLRTRIEFISSFFAPDEVDEIWLTFPDPYPGKRNSSKRLTSPLFLNSYRMFLKNMGIIHLKTDNSELYNYTKNIITENNLSLIFSSNDLYASDLENDIHAIRTHYENSFLNEGLKINYLSFRLEKTNHIQNDRKKYTDQQ